MYFPFTKRGHYELYKIKAADGRYAVWSKEKLDYVPGEKGKLFIDKPEGVVKVMNEMYKETIWRVEAV
jgi:hypothetical protein